MEKFYNIVIYFIILGVCGWMCETVFCSIVEKKFAYRGFLNGPICPIYGFGGLMVIYILHPFQENVFLLFLAGTIATTALEYVTSYILEKLFNAKWWDYSDRAFNINGRVCLLFSLMFGALSVIAVYFLYPPFSLLVEDIIPQNGKPFIAFIFLAVFAIDCFVTVSSLLKMNNNLEKVQQMYDEYKTEQEYKKEERKAEYKAFVDKLNDKIALSLEQKGITKFQIKRITAAFPSMKSTKFNDEFKELREHLRLKDNMEAIKKAVKNKFEELNKEKH